MINDVVLFSADSIGDIKENIESIIGEIAYKKQMTFSSTGYNYIHGSDMVTEKNDKPKVIHR